MLVFNCTKAAAEFFSVTRKGEVLSCLEAAPHKTIAESVEMPVFPADVEPHEHDGTQWHWVVHCVTVKRKKYLLVMDYVSRYCITFLATKKGDEINFLNTFEQMLKSNVEFLAELAGIDSVEVELALEQYDNKYNTCAFHARGDRSVQGHLNDVAWHLERQCFEEGMLLEPYDWTAFSAFVGQIPRNAKGRGKHFFPNKAFMDVWLQDIGVNNAVDDLSNIVFLSDYRK
ncbi:DUF6933 domain-containing protein [Shewanella litoralis]|uniref:DUF6933 domain-containing protein n=1 Tax=Shewanella litoralis TaxID=2282700 RepID=A0ABQ2RA66_9GAMM|nr:hypothetical protein [Shewanella litoralis]GGQ21620.1 hypothetical protein GCM10009411_22140 [Shewanella litoralis]